MQTDLVWEDPVANRNRFEALIKDPAVETDLLVLPEMFTTGFTMNAAALAETMEGPTIAWLQEMARLKQAAITGSLIIKEDENYFNRLIWATPDGKIQYYDKRHLFRMAQENAIYSAGKTRLMVNYKGWRICPLICYDLRFPVWSRQQPKQPYDLLIYVANWPEKRAVAWQTLLAARAIENLSYCVGVNRIGKDQLDIGYNGSSAICSAQGETFYLPTNQEIMHTQTLSHQQLHEFRKRFPAELDADTFLLT